MSCVCVYRVRVTQNSSGGFSRRFHTRDTSPDGTTQPMADNPFPTASSSSTTTAGGISFAEDPRAYYDKETGTWRLEDDDGNEFEYDQTKGAWVPLVRTLSLRSNSPPFGW